MVGLDAGVRVAHAMEDCFVAAQEARVTLEQKDIDRLLKATDLLVRIGDMPDAEEAVGPTTHRVSRSV